VFRSSYASVAVRRATSRDVRCGQWFRYFDPGTFVSGTPFAAGWHVFGFDFSICWHSGAVAAADAAVVAGESLDEVAAGGEAVAAGAGSSDRCSAL
jgi:hypothetical protein